MYNFIGSLNQKSVQKGEEQIVNQRAGKEMKL